MSPSDALRRIGPIIVACTPEDSPVPFWVLAETVGPLPVIHHSFIWFSLVH